MPISATDLLFKLSVKTGAAGNSTAGTPAGSLGKYISTTEVSGTTLNNLFDDISAAENAASTTDYRCLFIHNAHGTLTYQNAVVFFTGGDPAGGATVTCAVDNIAVSAIGSASAQAAEIANETTAPSGVGAYSLPTTAGTGLALGNIGPGQCKAIWIKRAAGNTAAADETLSINISGETNA